MQSGSSKRKRSPDTAILHEFTSLDALLDHDFAERKKKQVRDQKMQQLRDESSGKGGSKVDGSPLIQLMNDMESSMTSLSADSHLFAAELPRSQEKFGYVFTPITEVCYARVGDIEAKTVDPLLPCLLL